MRLSRGETRNFVETCINPRDQFMDAAEQELLALERKEREFRKKLERERAAELPLPLIKEALLLN